MALTICWKLLTANMTEGTGMWCGKGKGLQGRKVLLTGWSVRN
ncbi:hypothetical protein LINPERHAP1_LOCUS15681 [Linum perenne]